MTSTPSTRRLFDGVALSDALVDSHTGGFITPAAPYAIRFMGVVVAHALVVSAICFLGAGLVVFAWNAWEA